MTQDQKVKALKAIHEGRLQVEDLKPAKVFCFYQQLNGKGWSWKKGVLSEDQLIDFIKEKQTQNVRRQAVGLPIDQIILVNYESEKCNEQERKD